MTPVTSNSNREGLGSKAAELPLLIAIDDEDPSLRSLQRCFRKQYEFIGFSAPDAALEHFEDQGMRRPDVVIVDYMLPGMDGVELMRRAGHTCPDAIWFLITGHGELLVAIRAAKTDLPSYVFVSKPWEPEALRQLVERRLALRRATRRLEDINRHFGHRKG